MPCPHHTNASEETPSGFSRRNFVKTALAIGGASALSACVQWEGTMDVATGPDDPSDNPERLFEWNEYLPHGPHGNPVAPGNQLLLFLDYTGEGTPTAAEREQVTAAFESVERAFKWGTGDAFNPTKTDGLFYLMGYSRRYFDRFDAPLPDDLRFQRPEDVLAELDEDATPDQYDAVLILASGNVQVLLRTEQALRGAFDELNGVDVQGSFDGVFEVADRRTGFLGAGRPAKELDVDGVPDDSPTAMGFKSSFKDNQASEDAVAIQDGPFADGTTLQVSRLGLGLDRWYDNDKERRIDLMFSPSHDESDIGQVGERLAGKSQIKQETVEDTEEIAQERGMVGHTQKTAFARDEDFNPLLLRRTEGVSIDLERPSMNFASVQRDIDDFLETRKAMNGDHLDTDVKQENDGIESYVDVLRRGTYLIPPRSARALPTPTGAP